MKQIPINLKFKAKRLDAHFVVTGCNSVALQYLRQYKSWGKNQFSQFGKFCYLHGDKSSGKTSLINYWLYTNNALSNSIFIGYDNIKKFLHSDISNYDFIIIDNIEEITKNNNAEMSDILLHLVNQISESNKYGVLISRVPQADLVMRKDDLKSRILSMNAVEIGGIDIEMLKFRLYSEFAKRQIKVTSKTIDYIAKAIPHQFDTIKNTVDELDKFSCIEKSAITIPKVKKYFAGIVAAK